MPKRFPSIASPSFDLPRIYNEYCYRNGAEPSWAARVPDQVKSELRRNWLTGDYFDPIAILLRYREQLGFTCAIQDEGLIHEVSVALNISRLHYIRQLGFLHDPVINEAAADCGMGMRFEHTRYMHSLMVMATASLIGRHVSLSDYHLRHLQVAALTHDVLMPAGGDSVKPIDFEAFDEDTHYAEIFRNNLGWGKVRDRYALDENLLAATVRGEGTLGQLLDIADKTTYIAHDVDAYLMGDHDPRTFKNLVAPQSILAVWDLKQKLGKGACRLWDKIKIIDDRVVISDAEKLVGFLKLRALMFRHLYYNPLARYREQMLAFLILEPLYSDGSITRETLLTITDGELDRYLNQVTGCLNLRMEISRTEVAPVVEVFGTRSEALTRIRAIHQVSPDTLFMLEVIPRVSSKAIQYLVQDEAGLVKPFAEAFPDDASAIMSLDYDPHPAKLYILSPKKMGGILPKGLRKKLRARQRAQFNLE